MTTKYVHETWVVEKDVIYAAIGAVTAGLDYAKERLANHDAWLGRTTRKNRVWAESIEKDILNMEIALCLLKGCGPNK